MLEGGDSVSPHSPHPLYNPTKVRPSAITPCITAHPVGTVVALGIGAIVFVALPESRLFLLGSAAFGIVGGLVLWFRRR